MQKKRLSIILGAVCATLALIMLASLVACSESTPSPSPSPTPTSSPTAQPPAEPVTLEWVSFVPSTSSTIAGIEKTFINKVVESAAGDIVINYRGGPESIPNQDLPVAVQAGVIDLAVTTYGDYESLVHGANGAILTQISLEEERKPGGAYDYLVELHKSAGLFYLGRGVKTAEGFFRLALNKKVETQEDFTGLMIGGGPSARAPAVGWGATYSAVNLPEFYTAMERGMVDGIAGAAVSTWFNSGVYEVTKYMLDHPYYESSVSIIMNLDSWNQLPQNLQNIMMESIISSEKEQIALYAETEAQLIQKIKDGGVEFYKLSPDVAEWYVKTAYDAAWDYQQERFPEETQKLRELLSK